MAEDGWTRVLVATGMCLCVIGASCDSSSSTKWRASSPIATMDPTVTEAGGKIYVIGGILPKGLSDAVQVYDPATDTWAAKASAPTLRASAGGATVDGQIYVIGGRQIDEVLAKVERYDPESNQWTERTPMPTARWYPIVAVVDGSIYVMGGIAGTGNQRAALDVVERYDPRDDRWVQLPRMPVARSNAAVGVVGKEIYIVSGRLGVAESKSTTDRVDVYDTSTGRWKGAPPVLRGRSRPAVCSVRNKLYLISGWASTSNAATTAIEVYEPGQSAWYPGPSIRRARVAPSCAVVGGSIFVMAGMTKSEPSGIVGWVEEIPQDVLEGSGG